MTEDIRITNEGQVPVDVRQALLRDGTDVQTKVGHVAKFNHDGESSKLDENIAVEDFDNYKKPKDNNEFIGLTKEELKAYISNPKWKRIRWLIAILYLLLLVLLLVGAILLVIFSPRCPPKPKLVWYQKEIIYELDVTTFRDSNQDGIGDIKGVQEKLNYLEKNDIKVILLQPSIFNVTAGTSIQLNGRTALATNTDLYTIDPSVGNDNDLKDLLKTLNRKDMRLIIDLPLSSTFDPNGYSWYGSNSSLPSKINNPCINNSRSLGCPYFTSYGRLPLDFADQNIQTQAENRLRHWLSTNKVDGVRVDLPLNLNSSTRSYEISYETIDQWNTIKNDIEKQTKPKLLLFDVPFGLQDTIKKDDLHNKTAHALFLFNDQQRSPINALALDQRIQSFETNRLSAPQFWQLGSKRKSDDIGLVHDNQLSKEAVLTMIMLLGGTPVILYGEEIGLNQKSFPLMPWTSDGPYGGFSSCSRENCSNVSSSYQVNLQQTSVKRQEALGGESKDSLLNVFRRLSKLRRQESFQFGLLESGYDIKTNTFWFIREASGHRGYVIVFNLHQSEQAHISLHDLTKHDVPSHIHYEYQWPQAPLSTSNKAHIDSDNLFIHPRSINIFWWMPKLVKPNILFKTAKEHTHNQ
ncbi:unnamed protein product [Rotaria sordida]|uniref:Glycosyl hydrolase family 13 catalytic domain-containing protein n=1 Tax=Rotaria sordida TaxID=392033 RepID=A0A814CDF5_9BILA|nr:unnamed protein product [Rotaria sordida]